MLVAYVFNTTQLKQSFLTPYRVTLACPRKEGNIQNEVNSDDRTKRRQRRERAKKWPCFASIQDFEQTAGSKLKALVKLIQHHSSDDRAEAVVEWNTDTNDMKFPWLPPSPEPRPCNRKILVYFAFAMMHRTIVSVSDSILGWFAFI
jgi:hypothetical protein